MVLVVDMGNTNIVIGCMDIDDKKIILEKRVNTERSFLVDEYVVAIEKIFEEWDVSLDDIEGGIMSSTVPAVTKILKKAIEIVIGKEIINVTGALDTGMKIKREKPETLGADLIVCGVAGIHKYGTPLVVVDMGTCTTVSAIDKNGTYIGGTIMTGLKSSLDAMITHAPHLPEINLKKPDWVIGTDTVSAIQSGMLYGHAGAVKEIVSLFLKELGEDTKVVATGGLANTVLQCIDEEYILDKELMFIGLLAIYERLQSQK